MVFGVWSRGWQLVILVLWLSSAFGKTTKDDERAIVHSCSGIGWNVSDVASGDGEVWYAIHRCQTRAEREQYCDRLRSS